MRNLVRLNLAEELLLLALHDSKGSVVADGTALPYGVAGAVLLELALRKKVRIRGKKVHALPCRPAKESLLNHALDMIRASSKPRSVSYWLNRLSAKKWRYKDYYLNSLVAKGVLRREKKQLLWVIPTTRYPTRNPRPEMILRKHLRHVVLRGGELTTRTTVLLSLVQSCALIKEVFPKHERRRAKKRIKEIVSNEAIGCAISKAVRDATDAVTAAVAASAAASAAAATMT